MALATLAACAALLLPPQATAQTGGDKPLADLLAQERWPEALAAIDQQLKARPNDTQALMNRGAVLSNMNREADALATFRKVVAANPNLPAAHNNMAVILAAMGRYDEAKAALQRAIKAQPSYATAYENLGDLYAHQAAESYRKALDIDKTLKSAKTKLDLSTELVVLATGAPPAEPPRAAKPAAAPAAAPLATPPAVASAPAPAAPVRPASGPASAPAAAPAVKAAVPPTPASPAPAKPSAASAVPAPAVVAAAAPAPSAAAAKPGPAPATVPESPGGRAESTAKADVEAAVRAWVRAWSRRDVQRYTAAYAPDFNGGAESPAAWREQSRARISERSRITVTVSDLQISMAGDTAKARFNQSYESDQPASRRHTRKTLTLQKLQDRWLIREEVRN